MRAELLLKSYENNRKPPFSGAPKIRGAIPKAVLLNYWTFWRNNLSGDLPFGKISQQKSSEELLFSIITGQSQTLDAEHGRQQEV